MFCREMKNNVTKHIEKCRKNVTMLVLGGLGDARKEHYGEINLVEKSKK